MSQYISNIQKLCKSGNLEEALKTLEIASTCCNDNKTKYYINYFYGYIEIKKENFVSANEYLNKAITIDPKKEYAYIKLAICLNNLNQKKEAFDNINKALEINNKSINALIAKAQMCHENMNYEEEETVLYNLMEEKNDIDTQISLAKCFNCQFRFDKVDEVLKTIEQNEKEKSIIYALKSNLFKHRYQFKESLKYIDMAIDIDKNNQNYKLEKGYILFYYGDYQEAIKVLEPFIEQYTSETIPIKLIGAVFIVAFAYQRIGNEAKFNKYILIYQSKKKDETQYYYEIAIMHYFNNKKESFESLIDKSLQIQPNNIKALTMKIIILEDKGQFEEAKKIKEKYKKELEMYIKRDVFQMDSLTRTSMKIINDTIDSDDYIIESEGGINKPVASHTLKSISLLGFIQSDLVLIGTGGFGTVYRKQLEDGTVCAVKCMKKEHKTEEEINTINNCLTKEIFLLCRLPAHENVIKLLGFLPGKIIMEFAEGGDLAKVIYGNKDLPLKAKIHFIKGIANGLSYIHSKNIVHGDLKSSNVLLDRPYNSQNEQLPTPKIADFGLSAELDGKIMGYTPRFTAPEILNKKIRVRDFKSDIFSFGMVMYEIIEQHKPFYEIKNDNEVNRKIANGDIVNFKEGKWPIEIKKLCLKCLNFFPNGRPKADEIVIMLNSLK